MGFLEPLYQTDSGLASFRGAGSRKLQRKCRGCRAAVDHAAKSNVIVQSLHSCCRNRLQLAPYWGIIKITAKEDGRAGGNTGSSFPRAVQERGKSRKNVGCAKGRGLREAKWKTQQVYLWIRDHRQGYGLFHGEHVSDLLSYGHY